MLVGTARVSALLVAGSLLSSCTGLYAGPSVQSSASVAVPRDSAWVRARRGFSAEVMTLDVVDSVGGTLTGRRFPKSSAPEGALETCQILVRLNLAPASDGTGLNWDSRWVAPEALATTKSEMCENERVAVLGRIQQTIAPTP